MKPLSTETISTPSHGSLYKAAWRWHFYAGLLTAPLAIFMAITGALYLWVPQYEEAVHGHIYNVAPGDAQISAEAQLANAHAAFPQGKPYAFKPSFDPGRAAEARIKLPDGDRAYVYVNPHTGEVTGHRLKSERPKSILHDLHGSFMAGDVGGYIVELGTAWMFVLMLTGFYLWWPRPKFKVWGFFLPRLRSGSRTFWRDIHAVPAVWFSLMTLFLLTTGVPWSGVGGEWVRKLSAAIGEGSPQNRSPSVHQSELFGWSPPLQNGLAEKVDATESDPSQAGERPQRMSMDQAIEIAWERELVPPFAVTLPVHSRSVMSVMSSGDQVYDRAHLHLDQYSGKVVADVRYSDYGFFGKFFLWGIIAHEGRLFGLANQILGTVAAFGVLLMAASGLVLWWKRKPEGKLGAPKTQSELPRPVFWGTIALAPFLPLLAASLVLLFLGDALLSRRLPWMRN